VISGAFSITRQAVQLDLLPRLRVLQTSAQEQGQIYVPSVNFFMLVSVLLFVVTFGSSSALASAYGASVVGTMLLTTILGAAVAALHWRWGAVRVSQLFGAFLLVDMAFVAGNITKIPHGGWVPLTIAAAMYFVFITWRDGRITLRAELARRAVKLDELPKLLEGVARVPGTAVFLVSNAGFVPTALLRNLALHDIHHLLGSRLNMEITRTPRYVGPRAWVETLQPNVFAVRARFGFMETPDVMDALRSARQRGLKEIDRDVSFFLGWHLVRARPRPGLLADFRFRLFAYMQRRSAQARAERQEAESRAARERQRAAQLRAQADQAEARSRELDRRQDPQRAQQERARAQQYRAEMQQADARRLQAEQQARQASKTGAPAAR